MNSDFCFLFGSSIAPESCLLGVLDALEHCYAEHKIRTFIVGHYGNFDRIAANALTMLKTYHDDINLLLLIPYHPSTHPIEPRQGFQTYYPDGQETVIPKFAIATANNKMIQECSVAVCYPHGVTNSRKMYEKILKRKIPIYNVKEFLNIHIERPSND